MNILVAGVHGVGKTYLASHLPSHFGLFHTSASKLIKETLSIPNWDAGKRVGDIDINQIALATAVQRYNDANIRLLLDGHFVLLNAQGELSPLNPEIYRPLNLDGVILLEADPITIAARISERDNRDSDISHLSDFIKIERSQAKLVCEELNIPLKILNSPSVDEFICTVNSVFLNKK